MNEKDRAHAELKKMFETTNEQLIRWSEGQIIRSTNTIDIFHYYEKYPPGYQLFWRSSLGQFIRAGQGGDFPREWSVELEELSFMALYPLRISS